MFILSYKLQCIYTCAADDVQVVLGIVTKTCNINLYRYLYYSLSYNSRIYYHGNRCWYRRWREIVENRRKFGKQKIKNFLSDDHET